MAIARAHLVNPALARWYHCPVAPGVRAACVPVGRGARLEGKVAISRELAAIFDRLGTTAESWWSRLAKLSQGRLFGASSRRPATACRRSPTDWACAASSIWGDARHVETSGRLKLDVIGDRRPAARQVPVDSAMMVRPLRGSSRAAGACYGRFCMAGFGASMVLRAYGTIPAVCFARIIAVRYPRAHRARKPVLPETPPDRRFQRHIDVPDSVQEGHVGQGLADPNLFKIGINRLPGFVRNQRERLVIR